MPMPAERARAAVAALATTLEKLTDEHGADEALVQVALPFLVPMLSCGEEQVVADADEGVP